MSTILRLVQWSSVFVGIVAIAGCEGPQNSAPSVPPNQSATIAARTAQGTSKVASESAIYAFSAVPDGQQPDTGLINLHGTLYGTTPYGGNGNGTIYSVSPSGTEQVVYAFNGGSDGADPEDNLLALNGVLYGTTYSGGGNTTCQVRSGGCGTVFALDPSSRKEQVLYRFQTGSDGAYPDAGLLAVNGTLYGTTAGGGNLTCHCGTIFSVNPVTGKEHVLYRFKGGSDGAIPEASLFTLDNALYGTTYAGGTLTCSDGIAGCGTVFTLDIASRRERVMHAFQNGASDGAHPSAALTSMKGVLYGTTPGGGIEPCPGFGSASCGTVFSIQPSSGQERIVYLFRGDPDGAFPGAPLLAANGVLYGTTYQGGSGTPRCGGGGCGAVFRLTATGKERVLYSFQHIPDGAYPSSGLISANGAFYGTTQFGGAYNGGEGNGWGTVFKVLR